MYTFACPCLTDLERYTRKVNLIASGELARHLKGRGGGKLAPWQHQGGQDVGRKTFLSAFLLSPLLPEGGGRVSIIRRS